MWEKPDRLHPHTPVTGNKQVQSSCKIQNQHIKKSGAFLYPINEQPMKEMERIISFTMPPKRIKFLGISLEPRRWKLYNWKLQNFAEGN